MSTTNRGWKMRTTAGIRNSEQAAEMARLKRERDERDAEAARLREQVQELQAVGDKVGVPATC